MSSPEVVAHVGRMVRAERARLGYTSVEKATSAAGIKSYKTLAQFELGKSMPNAATRALIEDLLMWRDGSLTEALKQDDLEVLSFEWFRDWEKEEPVSAAADLSDEALLTELIKRLDRIRLQVAGAPAVVADVEAVVRGGKSASGGADFGKRTPAEMVHQSAYDLAAHTPRGGKKVDPRKATRK